MFGFSYDFDELSLLRIGPAEACIYATGRADIEFAGDGDWHVADIEIATFTPIKGGGWVEARTYLDTDSPIYGVIVAALERDEFDRISDRVAAEFDGGDLWGASPKAVHACHIGHCQREDMT